MVEILTRRSSDEKSDHLSGFKFFAVRLPASRSEKLGVLIAHVRPLAFSLVLNQTSTSFCVRFDAACALHLHVEHQHCIEFDCYLQCSYHALIQSKSGFGRRGCACFSPLCLFAVQSSNRCTGCVQANQREDCCGTYTHLRPSALHLLRTTARGAC